MTGGSIYLQKYLDLSKDSSGKLQIIILLFSYKEEAGVQICMKWDLNLGDPGIHPHPQTTELGIVRKLSKSEVSRKYLLHMRFSLIA
jgi:hypothetical protein